MRFVVATDGSNQSDRALEYAIDVAQRMDASLTLVHAVEPSIREGRPSDPITDLSEAERQLVLENIEHAEEHGLEILEEAAAQAKDGGVDVTTEMLYGDPVDALSTYASDEEFDGIFVGHRGLSSEQEGLTGSVAKGLVAHASVPVTVVR